MKPIAPSNRLADKISPYLRQHAANPVNWQPWDDEALALAREHDCPILLSIGYAACHWCHVMERESFSDPQVAARMNDSFVCVKVDREERPDLDKTYQLAHYLLSRQTGGWPLTVFLTPDEVPFFTGTYFPPTARHGMPSFTEVMERVVGAWTNHRDKIEEQNEVITRAVRDVDHDAGDGRVPPADTVGRCYADLGDSFDVENGGLGKAPKFPQAPALALATHGVAQGVEGLVPGMLATLSAMARGGLHDHVGGGFFRYCVDPTWDIPHFEKMLSDNAQLLGLFADAAVLLDDDGYAHVAHGTADWMLSEMAMPGGGFATSLDADSEGGEGGYYAWSKVEVRATLSPDLYESLAAHTNIGGPPNFEGGLHHLRMRPAEGCQRPEADLQAALDALRARRAGRVMPAADDKVVVADTALAAHALARAGLMLGNKEWLAAARSAIRFIEANMVEDGVLRTAWRAGTCSEVPAFLDDHACMLLASLSLVADGCRHEDVEAAVRVADQALELFDDGGGGLLFTARNAPATIRKIRACDDGPRPSGNAIMARCLMTLGWMLGDSGYLEKAERIIGGFADQITKAPIHCPTMCLALENYHRTPSVVTITGDGGKISALAKVAARAMARCETVLLQPSGTTPHQLLEKEQPDDGVLAHVCRGGVCQKPDPDASAALAHKRG